MQAYLWFPSNLIDKAALTCKLSWLGWHVTWTFITNLSTWADFFCLFVCMYICTWRPQVHTGCLLYSLSTLFFKAESLTEPELSDLVPLVEEQGSGILQSLLPWPHNCKCTPHAWCFPWVLGPKCRSTQRCNEHSINWAISSALVFNDR